MYIADDYYINIDTGDVFFHFYGYDWIKIFWPLKCNPNSKTKCLIQTLYHYNHYNHNSNQYK